MFSLQEYQHVHLLWFKKRSFTLVWKPNPPLHSVHGAHLRARADAASESTMGTHCSRSAYAPLLRCFYGRKPGSTEALALKAPLFTWSVKSFSCYNVLLWSSADHALAQVRPRQIFTRTLSKNGRSLEPCLALNSTWIQSWVHLEDETMPLKKTFEREITFRTGYWLWIRKSTWLGWVSGLLNGQKR